MALQDFSRLNKNKTSYQLLCDTKGDTQEILKYMSSLFFSTPPKTRWITCSPVIVLWSDRDLITFRRPSVEVPPPLSALLLCFFSKSDVGKRKCHSVRMTDLENWCLLSYPRSDQRHSCLSPNLCWRAEYLTHTHTHTHLTHTHTHKS